MHSFKVPRWFFATHLAILFILCARPCVGDKCYGRKRTPIDMVYCVEKEMNYNKARRPLRSNGTADPTDVLIDIVVAAIGINEQEGEFKLDFFMRQRWRDWALMYDSNSSYQTHEAEYTVFKADLLNHIWTPDTYIDNAKLLLTRYEQGALTNEGLRIYPDGRVFRSTRLSMTLYCHMNFHWFPLDIQNCFMNISSYAYHKDQISYRWRELTVDRQITIPQFVLTSVVHWENTLEFSAGNFSLLTAGFQFRREIHYYLLGFYIPAVLVVILSWISFWISPQSTPARVSLTIITVLAMAGFLIGDRNGFPKASYARAFDVYMIMCFGFVFGCLVEYAAVHYYLRDDRDFKKSDSDNNATLNKVQPFLLPSPSPSISTEMYDVTNRLDKNMANQRNGISQPFPLANPSPSNSAKMYDVTNRLDKNMANQQNGISGTRNVWKDRTILDVEGPCQPPKDAAKTSFLGSLRRRMKSSKTKGLDEISKIMFPLAFALFNAIYWILTLNMNYAAPFPLYSQSVSFS